MERLNDWLSECPVTGPAEIQRTLEFGSKQRRVATEILRYMAVYPEAKDTLDGIREWWLGPRGGCSPDECTKDDVRRAAEWLTAQGWLRSWEATPGMTVFGPSEPFLRSPQTAIDSNREGTA